MFNKQLSGRRQAARYFVSLNISPSHSMSLKIAPFDSSYWRSVVSTALLCIISEIKLDIGRKSPFFQTTAFDSPVREVPVGIFS